MIRSAVTSQFDGGGVGAGLLLTLGGWAPPPSGAEFLEAPKKFVGPNKLAPKVAEKSLDWPKTWRKSWPHHFRGWQVGGPWGGGNPPPWGAELQKGSRGLGGGGGRTANTPPGPPGADVRGRQCLHESRRKGFEQEWGPVWGVSSLLSPSRTGRSVWALPQDDEPRKSGGSDGARGIGRAGLWRQRTNAASASPGPPAGPCPPPPWSTHATCLSTAQPLCNEIDRQRQPDHIGARGGLGGIIFPHGTALVHYRDRMGRPCGQVRGDGQTGLVVPPLHFGGDLHFGDVDPERRGHPRRDLTSTAVVCDVHNPWGRRQDGETQRSQHPSESHRQLPSVRHSGHLAPCGPPNGGAVSVWGCESVGL